MSGPLSKRRNRFRPFLPGYPAPPDEIWPYGGTPAQVGYGIASVLTHALPPATGYNVGSDWKLGPMWMVGTAVG
ncbi:MAG: hypothetical protein R3C44_24425 [Chloroflexota bacterium]